MAKPKVLRFRQLGFTRRCGDAGIAELSIAGILTLLGAVLLVSSQSSSRGLMLSSISNAIFILLVSAFDYRFITRTWASMGEVLSTGTLVVPGESLKYPYQVHLEEAEIMGID